MDRQKSREGQGIQRKILRIRAADRKALLTPDEAERIAQQKSQYYAQYYLDNKDKSAARSAVARAVSSGRLEVKPCETCDREPEKISGLQVIEFHHAYGYERENWLRGQWLCRQECHPAADKIIEQRTGNQ